MKLTISIDKEYDPKLNDTSSSEFWKLKQLVEKQVYFVWYMVSSYIQGHLYIIDGNILVIFRFYQTRDAQGNI